MVLPVRRIVTGQTPERKSVFTHVEDVTPIVMASGMSWYGVWGWDELPVLPYFDSAGYTPRSAFPGPGQLRVNTVVFPPGYGVVKPTGAATAGPPEEYKRLLAAQPPGGEHNHETGMHSTDSVEFGFVFSGEVTLVQDDNAEVTLRPGDVYVQNGALHAWRNRGDEPCMICFLVVGTTRTAGEAGQPTG